MQCKSDHLSLLKKSRMFSDLLAYFSVSRQLFYSPAEMNWFLQQKKTTNSVSPTRVEISLSFLISSWVLVGPGLEFPNIEKTGRVAVSTRLVFLDQKKLIGAHRVLGPSEEFLVSLKYGKSICIWRSPD